MERFEDTRITVKKTQISFSNKYNFAFVSLPLRKVKGRPEQYIIITFGLGRQEKHDRIEQSVEPYPGRWTHHVIIDHVEQVDDQLMAWLEEAYWFSVNKK